MGIVSMGFQPNLFQFFKLNRFASPVKLLQFPKDGVAWNNYNFFSTRFSIIVFHVVLYYELRLRRLTLYLFFVLFLLAIIIKLTLLILTLI